MVSSGLPALEFDVGLDEFIDTDQNSLPDWWELSYWSSPSGIAPESDRMMMEKNNLGEYLRSSGPVGSPRYRNYVSLAGDDTWDGLSSEWDGEHGPKNTIQAGIDAAHQFEGR